MKLKPIAFAILMPFSISSWEKKPPIYTKAEILGNFNPVKHREFKRLRSKYTTKKNACLRKEAYDAFKKMWKNARKDGINLIIISATRSWSYQNDIWNRKWDSFIGEEEDRAKRILQYTSMPGTSRHHWGTDLDLNFLDNSYFENGQGLRIYQWLVQNAHKYSFYQPYTLYDDYRDTGYREEKWHWSYYPLAARFQRAYNHIITYEDLKRFDGWEYAEKLDVINNYVNAVAQIP